MPDTNTTIDLDYTRAADMDQAAKDTRIFNGLESLRRYPRLACAFLTMTYERRIFEATALASKKEMWILIANCVCGAKLDQNKTECPARLQSPLDVHLRSPMHLQ